MSSDSLHLGRSEVLRRLRQYVRQGSQGHSTMDRTERRSSERQPSAIHSLQERRLSRFKNQASVPLIISHEKI